MADTAADLARRKCVACDRATPRIGRQRVRALVAALPGWSAKSRQRRIGKRFEFRDFRAAMAFVNRMADIAELEGHHPDFRVHYRRVDVSIWTHVAGGLTENDFVLAAKIDRLPARAQRSATARRR